MAKDIRGPDNDVFYGLRGEDVLPEHIRADAASRKGQAKQGGPAMIFGVMALVSLACTILLGFFGSAVLPSGAEWVLIAAFGFTFFFFGCLMLSERVWFGLAFALVGGSVGGMALTYGLSGEDLRIFLMETVAPLMGCSLFTIAGLCLMTIPGIAAKRKAATHTEEVPARVIKKDARFSRDSDGHTHRTWVLTWTYRHNGRDYTYRSNTSRSPEPRAVGSEGVLYLDPRDPEDVWEKPGRAEKILVMILGACFTAAGLAASALFLGFFT